MTTAFDIARSAGLRVVMRGQRGWTNCPAHEDKTPSLCLYPDGRFYCFSCKAHGNARALFRLIYGRDIQGEAPHNANPITELMRALQGKERKLNGILSQERLEAQAELDRIEKSATIRDALWDSPAFCKALIRRSTADCMLDMMDHFTEREWDEL